jgi:tripartite-type tricarboxylate transporter receptor subunit TctC
VVAVQPGGNLDLLARSVADYIGHGLNQRVVVENRPGGNGAIGFGFVAHAAPDGYTLIMTAQSSLVTARLMKNPPFDPVKDFAGVSLIANVNGVLVVHPSLPVKSVKELIALAKSRPGELNASTSGNGSGAHLALEIFNRKAGVKITRIAYNGDGPANIDLLGGHVQLKFDNISTSIQNIRSGRIRPLGVTSLQRSPLLPDVPPIADTLPGYESVVMNGMLAPLGTPPEILAKVHAEIVKFTQAPEVRTRFANQGVELKASASPADFSAYIKKEYANLSKLIDDIGITAE